MTRGCSSVRRLSTVPSVLQPSFILTTEWFWFWEDESGNWIQYATAVSDVLRYLTILFNIWKGSVLVCIDQDGGHRLSSISSAELEQKYQADNNAVLEFTAGSQTYELSFMGNDDLKHTHYCEILSTPPTNITLIIVLKKPHAAAVLLFRYDPDKQKLHNQKSRQTSPQICVRGWCSNHQDDVSKHSSISLELSETCMTEKTLHVCF